jgi:hypothetical protein
LLGLTLAKDSNSSLASLTEQSVAMRAQPKIVGPRSKI